jgi:hypothetical protein
MAHLLRAVAAARRTDAGGWTFATIHLLRATDAHSAAAARRQRHAGERDRNREYHGG